MRSWPGLPALLLFFGCAGDRAAERSPGAGTAPGAPVVSDSLALRTPSGDVWFTGARQATDDSGNACRERVMEIRQGSRRTSIPLLYTGAKPRLVNDSTIEAAIWLHCRPGNVYRVNLRTGQPVRVK